MAQSYIERAALLGPYHAPFFIEENEVSPLAIELAEDSRWRKSSLDFKEAILAGGAFLFGHEIKVKPKGELWLGGL